MTDYLITHDSLAGGLMMVSFLLLMVSVYGLVLFYRFSALWFCCLLTAFACSLPYHFMIKAERDQQRVSQAALKVTPDEYRRLASMMSTAPQPLDLTGIMDDGVVSRVNSKTFAKFDHALMRFHEATTRTTYRERR